MAATLPGRVEALDLIRGVAVLGILAINIAGFAGPPVAILTPHQPTPGSFADEVVFAVGFLLFEGKMRALFSILFGASLVLFVERTEQRGGFGDAAQMRRLGWLALFGLMHFYLLWWGDILFLLAFGGIVALLVRELPVKTLTIAAIAIFAVWHGVGMALSMPAIATEEQVRLGTANAMQQEEHALYMQAVAAKAQEDIQSVTGGFVDQAMARITDQTFQPFISVLTVMGETIPLMLLGVVLYRTGFFTGRWHRRAINLTAWLGIGTGTFLTALLLGWAWPRGFPLHTMEAFSLYWSALPHALMAIGYAAMLVLAAPRLLRSAVGRRLADAGRMAFSNYIGTSLVMTFLFYGWGLGLMDSYGEAELLAFVLAGWLVMLTWSKLWLMRYRRGPLEWAWRSLVQKRLLTNSR